MVRFYDPTTATFLTRDPANATTRSAYGYVYDNPLNATDPGGLASQDLPGGFCVRAPFTSDDGCNTDQQYKQDVADGAAGVLDTVSGGNADRITQAAGVEDHVRWDSPSMQVGRAVGFVPSLLNPGAFLASTTVGGFVNGLDTTQACLRGHGGSLCGVDVAFAWANVAAPYGAGRALGLFGPDVARMAQLWLSIMVTSGDSAWDLIRCGVSQ